MLNIYGWCFANLFNLFVSYGHRTIFNRSYTI